MSTAHVADDSRVGPFEPVNTLLDILRSAAAKQPDRLAYRFLTGQSATAEATLTYAELAHRAEQIGAHLSTTSRPGERAALLFDPGLDFVTAFFGALLAELVCVPLSPPYGTRYGGVPGKLRAILADAQPSLLLTTAEMLLTLRDWATNDPLLDRVRCLAVDEIDTPTPEAWQQPEIRADALCLLQYTSGSTSTPNGVMLTHRALVHNLRSIHRCYGVRAYSVGVSWLPHFHDMGLVGGVLAPMYSSVPITMMSPMDFLRRPSRWLQAISDLRATISMAPNFAFELCLLRVSDEQRAALDLSCWETAGVGAEPVRAETLRRFADRFAACGFRREAFLPCYGLAEATLLVSGHKPPDTPPSMLAVRAGELERHAAVEAADDAAAPVLVSAGRPSPDVDVRIVDPDTLLPCADGRVGEIWVAGPNVGHGYWNRPEQTGETFGGYLADTGEGPYLRTGDLGFLRHGELFPTGRIKDLIIVDGRNHYPHDIERTVASVAAAVMRRPDGCAAFAVDLDNTERVIVCVEVNGAVIARTAQRDAEATHATGAVQVVQSIRAAVAHEHDLQVHEVCLIKSGTLPRTTSGKVRRSTCREMYRRGTFKPTQI